MLKTLDLSSVLKAVENLLHIAVKGSIIAWNKDIKLRLELQLTWKL